MRQAVWREGQRDGRNQRATKQGEGMTVREGEKNHDHEEINKYGSCTCKPDLEDGLHHTSNETQPGGFRKY